MLICVSETKVPDGEKRQKVLHIRTELLNLKDELNQSCTFISTVSSYPLWSDVTFPKSRMIGGK